VNGKEAGKERLNRDFYTGSIFLKSYIQSFAQECKEFTQNNKFTYNYVTKIQS